MKKTILINIALILSFFLLFEIYLRIFDLSSLRGLSETYSENRKNLEGRAFGEKFYTDQYGFRVPNKNFSYVEKNKNIILIGDSFVFGPGVNEEITFSGKLRKERNKFNVYNSARPGDQINDYYFQIKYFVENFSESRFLIFINFDDINFFKKDKDNVVENIRNIKIINKINNYLRSRLYSYVWLVGILTDPSKRYYENVNIKFKDEKLFERFAIEIEKINNFLEEEKIENIFFIIPYNYQIRQNCKKTDFIPQRKLSKFFIERKINYYDFTEVFCKKSKDNNLYINFDPTHLSPVGHQVIFDYIKKL